MHKIPGLHVISWGLMLAVVAGCASVPGTPTQSAAPISTATVAPEAMPTSIPTASSTLTEVPVGSIVWPEHGAYFGAWVGPNPGYEYQTQQFQDFEDRLGSELDIIHELTGFVYSPDQDAVMMNKFPFLLLRHYCPENRVILLSAAPWIREISVSPNPATILGEESGGMKGKFTLQQIVDGQYDDLFLKWAEAVKTMPCPVIIRFGWEMNRDFYAWSGPLNFGPAGEEAWNEVSDLYGQYGDPTLADGPERWRDMVSHVMDLFDEVGPDNVYWAFGPDASSEPSVDWNNLDRYWVDRWDVIAPTVTIDASDSAATTFGSKYEAEIAPFVAEHPKPVLIAAYKAGVDSRKAQDYRDAFDYAESHPEITGLVVFAEGQWSPETVPEAWDVVKQAAASDYFNP